MDLSQYNAESYVDEMLNRTKAFFSDNELNNLKNATVAIVGVGASGSMVTELLARWGVGKFRLLDMDKFEISNINRQILATTESIGKWKTAAAKDRILAINPFATVEQTINEKLSLLNVNSFIFGADIVINASDTRSGFFLIHTIASRLAIPVVEGHGWKMTGIKIRVFDYRKKDQRKYDEPFQFKILNRFVSRFIDSTKKPFEQMKQEDIDNLDDPMAMSGGSLGTTTTLVGCCIVIEVIKLLTGKGKIYRHPKEISINLFDMTFGISNKFSLTKIFNTFKKRFNEIHKNILSKK